MKKMNLFTLTCMCIGTIIGVGIFGSMPSAAAYAGPSLMFVCIVGVIEIIIRYLPSLIPSSAIPASNGFYMYLTKLVSPYIGFLQVIQILFNVFVLALLATVFGQYFNLVMTADQTIVAVIVILVFSCISYFGVSIGALVQNVMVIVLVIALGVYIALGLPNVSPEFFTLGKAISFENVDFLSFGAALGLIASCLMGGYVGVNYAEQVKNPGKNVILAFLFSTVIVGIIIAVTQFIPALRVRKRYPLCYKNAPINLPTGLIYCLIVVALGFCIYEAYSLITTSSGMVWIALIATIVLCYGYFFGRIAYLRRKGIDLIAIMSAPYEPWEQKELEYAAKERS